MEHRKPGFSAPVSTGRHGQAPFTHIAAIATAILIASPLPARAERDYLATSRDWNGLSDLVELGRDAGVDVDSPARVDLRSLGPDDGLLLVHPTAPLPRADLVAFLRAGGRVALADDFGTGNALLEAFGIGRHAPSSTAPAQRLRGNRNVLVAVPRAPHPLTHDVRALVANHPRVLHHPSLAPIVSLGEGHGALVLVGAVGEGRLVAIGDPSMLINNMLEFRDNRAFAANLLRYLGPSGRVVLASGDALLDGSPTTVHEARPLAVLRTSLERLARVRLPPAAIVTITMVIAMLLLAAAGMALPRRDHYLRSTRIATPRPAAGLAGRVAWYARPGRDLALPLADFEHELTAELRARLDLPRDSSTARLLDAIAARSHGAALVAQARAIFRELERSRARREHGRGARRVSARELRRLVGAGRRLLAALGKARGSGQA